MINLQPSSAQQIPSNHYSDPSANEVIQNYFDNFKTLAKAKQWSEIISQGIEALKIAKEMGRKSDEAKINAQLTSTSFYLGDYDQALVYANRCHELAEFIDTPLFLRALYLESAVYRSLAPKKNTEHDQQLTFRRAVEIAEHALVIYSEELIDDINLHGKILFNLGAAHADNPTSNLGKATEYYLKALICFTDSDPVKHNDSVDDQIRTHIRLGKVYLLQNDYHSTQKIVDEVRLQTTDKRLIMHTDYLEAQLKHSQKVSEDALRIANQGLQQARNLGAKGDESRFLSLIEQIVKE